MGSWRDVANRLWHQDRPVVMRLLVVGALGLALVVAGSWPRAPAGSRSGSDAPASSPLPLIQEERSLDEEVAAMVSAIPGAGRVSAGVSLARTAMTQYSGTATRSVVETAPDVSGVVVVATGAKSAAVRTEITEAVETLLQIQPYQVLVLPDGSVPVGGP
jgi:stage III sporulation protein AG